MNKKRTQKFISALALSVVLGLVSLYPNSVSAQGFNLTVTPEVHYMRIKPGSKIRHTITLENKGDVALTVTPTIYDFEADGESGRAILKSATTFPYLDLEHIQNSSLTIPPHKRAQLGLLFSVPEDAPEKEYPLTVLFKSEPVQSQTETSQSQLVGAIGSNLIVLISQDEQTSDLINIDSISIPFFVDSFKKVTLQPKIKNNHFAATNTAGTVIVKNMFNTEVARFNIFPDTILGYSSRILRALKTEFQPDIEPEAVPFAFKTSFLLGLYTVEVSITAPYTSAYSDEVIAFDTFTFFAVPIIPILVGLLGIVSAIGYVIYKK